MVSYVETARGPVELPRLGRVLMHEHVFVTTPEVQANWRLPDGLAWDEEHRITQAAARPNELYAAGISTLVDLTVVGLGRDVRRIARLAALTDLNIVVATGLYVLTDMQHPFYYNGPGTALGGVNEGIWGGSTESERRAMLGDWTPAVPRQKRARHA